MRGSDAASAVINSPGHASVRRSRWSLNIARVATWSLSENQTAPQVGARTRR